jgi:NMD protein affecting ribosome stability and mRNA decay
MCWLFGHKMKKWCVTEIKKTGDILRSGPEIKLKACRRCGKPMMQIA